MSNYLAIASVTASLTEVLRPIVENDVSGATVTVARPQGLSGGNGTASPRVNIYLYQVTSNTGWRNMDLPTRDGRGAQRQRPMVALDLHYLFTFYGNENNLEPERLLGSVTRTLHTYPVLDRPAVRSAMLAYDYLAESDLADSVELVKFAPVPFSLEELSKLWSVFLQTSYTLSVAYKGTTVLIEAESPGASPLPVRRRGLYVKPLKRPRIETVANKDGSRNTIDIDSTLRVEGADILGDVTLIRIGSHTVELPQTLPPGATERPTLTNRALHVELGWLPQGVLRAGTHPVQVVHQALFGEPPKPHRALESNALPLLLRPLVVPGSIAASRGFGDEASIVTFTLSVRPGVGSRQRVVLLLAQTGDSGDNSYSLPAEVDAENPSVVLCRAHGVEAGSYLVRVQIDGAESELGVDQDSSSPTHGRYNQPLVEVP